MLEPTTQQHPEQPTSDLRVLLSIKNTAKVCDCSTGSIWRFMKTRGFPQPIRIGPQTVRWRSSEVLAWIEGEAEKEYVPTDRKPSPGRPPKKSANLRKR